jgi:hypothetical protein
VPQKFYSATEGGCGPQFFINIHTAGSAVPHDFRRAQKHKMAPSFLMEPFRI